MSKKPAKHGILKLLLVQLGATLIVSSLCAFALDYNAALSALLGGLVCVIPNTYFAIKLFTYQGARSAKKIVNNFYKGEAVKMILSIILFTVVFVWIRITPLVFFASYITILMTHWLAPLIIVTKQNRFKRD